MTPFMAERGTRLASTTFADFVDIGVLNSGNVYACGGETTSVSMYGVGGGAGIGLRDDQSSYIWGSGAEPTNNVGIDHTNGSKE